MPSFRCCGRYWPGSPEASRPAIAAGAPTADGTDSAPEHLQSAWRNCTWDCHKCMQSWRTATSYCTKGLITFRVTHSNQPVQLTFVNQVWKKGKLHSDWSPWAGWQFLCAIITYILYLSGNLHCGGKKSKWPFTYLSSFHVKTVRYTGGEIHCI